MVLGVLLGLSLMAWMFLPAAASAAECTDTWTGPAEGTWQTATNWSAKHVPGSSDVACIGSGSKVVLKKGASVAVVGIQGEGTLELTETALEVTGTGGTGQLARLRLGYEGNLSGAGTLEITKELHWSGPGKMSGTGQTILGPYSESTIGSVNSFYRLSGRRLVNKGVVSQPGTGNLFLEEGGVFENVGTYVANAAGSTWQMQGTGVGSLFLNRGLFEKTEGTVSYGINANFENLGTIRAASGLIRFVRASLAFGAGSVLEGTIESQEESVAVKSLEAPNATLKINGDELTVAPGSYAVIGTLEIYGMTLNGAGTLEIVHAMSSKAEFSLSGSGETILAPGSHSIMEDGAVTVMLSERRLINEGTFTQAKETKLNIIAGANFVNRGTYNFNPTVIAKIESLGTSHGQFTNHGILQRTVGAAIGEVSAPFEEASGGTVSGKIQIKTPITVAASTATPGHCKTHDPVDCATGNLTESQTDFEIGGRGVGLDLTRTYSAQSAAAGSLGIFGYGWTNSFGDRLATEESGGKQTLTESSGSTVTFTKSGATWIAPSWTADALAGSAESGFTLTLPDQTREKFNGSGRLESVTDRNGNETTLVYDGSGELETITDPTGRKIILTYNGEGLVEKAKDPMGHEVKYAYESKQLKSVTLPGEAGPTWQFKYDASHRMTSVTDGRGGKTTDEYDASNRVISQTDPAERKTTFTYEGFHTTITNNATGAVTDERFNSNNQPISVTHGHGTAAATTTTLTYTAAGLLASKTDGNGYTTAFEYDAHGNRTKETDPEGDETRWTYNGAHQVVTETTPSGETTTIVRDAQGNPETVSRPAPESKTQTVSYAYGPHGELESTTNPLGATWTYGYDKYGDRTSETDPESDERTWAFNEDSQVISTVSPRGNEAGAEPAKFTTTIERDAQGRPIKVTDPLGGTTKRAYDADGNVESITDPNGHKTKFTYDADNERTKVERPNGAVEETGYDGAGQVASQVDGDKQKTTYVRNVLEQPVEIIDPLERKTTETFDAAGNLKTKTDPDGRVTTYGYDKANRLKEVSYSAEPGQDATYAYNKDGDLTGMVDGTGESTWEYDQLGRLNHSEDGNGETVSWEYDLGDEPVGLTYPNGKSISRAYDEAGRLESVTDWLGHTTSFAYNADSAPTATTFPASTTDTDEYGYDRADRMASVTMKRGAETLASLAYTRDPAGQLESLISKDLPGAEEESFGYDEDERLTKAGAAEFGYDAANNITKAPGTTNAFDKASQIESATGATFTFDKEGERTKETPSSGPATTYKYDQAGSLKAVERPEEGETPAISESFGYDGLGVLASRTVGLSTTHFVWDLNESPEPLLSDGADSYIYGPGGLAVEEISSGEEPTYLHHDQIGSTRLLTNGSGEVSGTFTYGPYGGLTGHTGTATTALGYAGQYTLGQSGLLYLRARFYDPATAQFLTLDPAVEMTREPYGYAGDNPLRFKDPSGLWFAEELGDVGIPCIPCEAAQGVQELLEPSYEDAVAGGNWVLNQLGTEELDEGDSAAEEVPCGEETRAERGTRRETREEEETFRAKEEHLRSSNPGNPNWLPSGPRSQAVAALIIKLLTQFFHGQG
jgi:RHS repeat-associated protein